MMMIDTPESREHQQIAGGQITNEKEQNDDDDDDDENDDSFCRTRKQRIEEHRRWSLFAFSAAYTFLYVGSFYGWGPMQLLLEENGSFSWKCSSSSASSQENQEQNSPSASATAETTSTSAVCSEQTYALLRINLIATVTQILSPALGQFVDVYGAKRGFFFFTGSLWIGLLLLTIASARNNANMSMSVVMALDRLLYVAFCFMAMATWMGGLLTVHTGLFFTGHARSRVIFILNSLFDSGSITYLFLWWFHDNEALFPNVNLTILAAGFLCSAVVITSGALYFWVVAVPQLEDYELEAAATRTTAVVTPPSTRDVAEARDANEVTGCSTQRTTENAHIMNTDKKDEMTQEAEEESNNQIMNNDNDKQDEMIQDAVAASAAAESNSQQQPPSLLLLSNDDQNHNHHTSSYVLVADRTPRQQLLSTPYLLLCGYFAIHTTSNQWNLATQRDFLAYLGDDEQGNKYLSIFILLMPASLVGLPLVDYSILHFGFTGAFQTINALSLGYTVIKVSSDNLNVQILGFIIFSFYRCFLFGVSISFLPTLIGPHVVGKAVGILYAVAGMMSFINIPFAKLAVEQLDGNFFIPNLIFCILVIPCILLAFLIGHRIKQEDRAKESKDAATGRPKSDEKHIPK